MWTIIGQSGVMNGVVNMTTAFAPVVWGVLGVFVLSAVGITWLSVREYWAHQFTQPQEPMAEEQKMAA
jgi:hypothetical protein